MKRMMTLPKKLNSNCNVGWTASYQNAKILCFFPNVFKPIGRRVSIIAQRCLPSRAQCDHNQACERSIRATARCNNQGEAVAHEAQSQTKWDPSKEAMRKESQELNRAETQQSTPARRDIHIHSIK